MKTGLVSVSFRKLSLRQITGLAAEAGLDGIEWGGDVHVPHGELDVARDAARLTLDAGLDVASYGSYYRCAESEEAGLSFAAVVDTARELGAPTIRVWPGRQGSADAEPAYRAKVVDDLRNAGALAAEAGMGLGIEFHSHSLTDTNASAQQLIAEVGHPNVRLYWQQSIGESHEYCCDGLAAILQCLANLHVFYYTSTGDEREQRPLSEGEAVWADYLRLAASVPGERWAMLEFVRGETREQLLEDAATLLEWTARLAR